MKDLSKKDLMLGDWVDCLESDHRSRTYAQIEAIEEYNNILVKKENRNWFLDIENIKPIPLTKDVIKKNGASWYNELKLYVIDGVYLSYDERNNCFDVGNVGTGFYGKVFHNFTMISYVHELQHLLRLFGSEKEIKL